MKYSFLFLNHDPARISDADFLCVVEANLLQQVDLANEYGLLPALVSELPISKAIPSSTEEMTFIPVYFRPSTPQDPDGAVAFHWVDPVTDRPTCVVFTDVVAQLPGPGDFVDKLSTSASHECCECREDIFADEWADMPDGTQESFELCDRVQSASYPKDVTSGRTVQVSDFLFAAAFSVDPLPPGTKCDMMGLIPSSNPRAILPGGYAAVRDKNGNTTQIMGDKIMAMRYSHHTMLKLGADFESDRSKRARTTIKSINVVLESKEITLTAEEKEVMSKISARLAEVVAVDEKMYRVPSA